MSARIPAITARLQDAGYMLIRKRDRTYVIARPPMGPMSRSLRGIEDVARFAAILGVWTPGVRHE